MADAPRLRSRRLRHVVVLAAAAWVAVPTAEALAAWTTPASGSASAASASVPAGPAPTVAVDGRNVTVSWPAIALSSGDAVSGYVVRRTSSTGANAAIGAGCITVQTGLTCTEAVVSPGTWAYGVTATAGTWSGVEGPRTTVVVAPPTFALSSASLVAGSPGTVTGTVSGYVGPATLSFRLDNATSGTPLPATPATVPSGGRTDVTVSIPAGVADGPHTIYAVGSGGDVVGAALVVDSTRPSPVTLTTADGGGNPGSIEAADVVAVTFSEKLSASSLCAAWADDGTAKSLTAGVTVSVANNGSATSTDLMSVLAPACGSSGFHFGQLDLGGKGYVRNGTTATFGATGTSSTITWDPATATLRIVFGSSSTNRFGTVNSSVAVYTPDPAITDRNGLPITGTASRSGRQL